MKNEKNEKNGMRGMCDEQRKRRISKRSEK